MNVLKTGICKRKSSCEYTGLRNSLCLLTFSTLTFGQRHVFSLDDHSRQPVPVLCQCVAFGRSTPAAAICFPFPVTHCSPVCTPTVPASPLPSRAQDSTGPPGVRITAPVAPGTVPRYARAGSAQRRRLVGATTPEPPSSQPAGRARTRQGRGSSRLLTSRRVRIARNNKTYRLYRAARVRSGVISRRSARRRGPAARRSPANGDFRGRSVPPGPAPPRRTFPAAPARPPPPPFRSRAARCRRGALRTGSGAASSPRQ